MEQIEILETLAYEDKVTAQVRTLEEATSSLWHLHHSLVATRRLLKRHQQSLRLYQRSDGKQAPTATPTPNGGYRHGEAGRNPLAKKPNRCLQGRARRAALCGPGRYAGGRS